MNRFLQITTIVLATLLLLALAVLSVRGMLDPRAAAHAFGVPAADESAAFYHAVYRDRNLVLSLVGIAFLCSRMWRALAILVTISISLPAYDITVLKLAQVPVAPAHTATLVSLVVLAVVSWLHVLKTKAP